MANLNRITIIGNVGRDPEMRFTPSGTPVTDFSVATNEVYTDNEGERHTSTEWFTIVAWNKLAETCNQFLEKGRQVYVEGRLKTRSWEGQDGEKKYRTEVIANRVLFLGKRDELSVEPEDKGEVEVKTEEEEPDDIPF